MITNKFALSSSAPVAATPYGQRLRLLAESHGTGAEITNLLHGMIRCVDSAAYGRLRILFRCLPIVHRQHLGLPPSCREQDTPEQLQW